MKLYTLLLIAIIPAKPGFADVATAAKETLPVVEILQQFHPQNLEDCAVLAIGGPELMRYSLVSDFIETQILELAYVDHGLSYADFSIGKFQMKPSFVERLELEICRRPGLRTKYDQLVSYQSATTKGIREDRLERIKSSVFQKLLMSAFYDYCHQEYCEYLDKQPISTVIAFIGTTYNLGFDHSVDQILDYQRLRRFPYGANFHGEQYAYGALSAKIYKQLIKSLCKSTLSTSSQDCYSGPVRNHCPS